MAISSRALRFGIPLLLVAPLAYRATTLVVSYAPVPKYSESLASGGKELFLHEWTPRDPLAGQGDGLGPVFNAKSCVACHRDGGVGGGGPITNNVTAFAVRVTEKQKLNADKKPLPAERQGVVHAFSTEPEFQETLASVSDGFTAIRNPSLADLLIPFPNPQCVTKPPIGAVDGVDISQRNTPALFGANLIDAIPDRAIIAHERIQRLKWGLASSATEEFPVGRALRLGNNRVGKFGWKAQKASLNDFVRAACANELGLGNPSDAQPASMSHEKYEPPGLDLTNEQCDQLTAFVLSLPKPIESVDAHAKKGKAVFASIGCADCHVPDLGGVKGLYSDLMLHRMGRNLVGGGSYGDPAIDLPDVDDDGEPDPSEWRTPPLWGLADSAPYLHDGRASTIEQSIALHGGQATKSAMKFGMLEADKRGYLLDFLQSLKAPRNTIPAPAEAVAVTVNER